MAEANPTQVIHILQAEMQRKELDNAALANRLQMYSDVLVEIAGLKHYEAQKALTLAREALKA